MRALTKGVTYLRAVVGSRIAMRLGQWLAVFVAAWVFGFVLTGFRSPFYQARGVLSPCFGYNRFWTLDEQQTNMALFHLLSG